MLRALLPNARPSRRWAPTLALIRPFSSTSSAQSRPTYTPAPRPPPLRAAEQREIDELRKAAEAQQMHPDMRNLGPEEFEGDENPRTGEVGGPKRDPLKWEREWTFGGRASDF